MPPVSQAQRGAMRAAAAGRSTIGIPKNVGEEFDAADQGGTLPKRVGAKKGKPGKGKKKFVLKKKAKKPPVPPRRPVMEPMPPEDGGY